MTTKDILCTYITQTTRGYHVGFAGEEGFEYSFETAEKPVYDVGKSYTLRIDSTPTDTKFEFSLVHGVEYLKAVEG